MKKNRFVLAIALILVLMTAMACKIGDILPGDATDVPVTAEPPNPPAGGGVDVFSTYSFTDTYGGYYVYGEITNNSSSAVTSLALSISISDAAGASLLKDEAGSPVDSLTFYPMLWTLAPEESSPFSYYFDTTGGIPANYNVVVSEYSPTTVERADLETQNVQIFDDGSGYFVLTGEIVNLGTGWAHINGLAGGVLDDADTTLAADWTGTYTAILAPAGDPGLRDRTPFYVSIPVPPDESTQWVMWWDADVATDVIDYPVTVTITNSYFDQFGSAHVVGLAGNNSDESLTGLVVAGLYAEDGTVLDASYSFIQVNILPGEQVPFDVTYFGNVNWNEDQAALVSSYTVQFDLWNTYPSYLLEAALSESGQTIVKDGGTWTVTGNFSNTSDQNLTGATVLVAVFDSSGVLVATAYTSEYPTDGVFAPGSGDAYEIYLYLDPGVDTSGFTTRTFVVGYVSE